MLKGPVEKPLYTKGVKVQAELPLTKKTYLISNAPRPDKILKIVKKDKIEEADLDRVKVDAFDR